MENTPLIEFRDVSKIYHMGDEIIRAADHISFKIYKGEFIAIVGQSGSGKSITMEGIMGILPKNGKVTEGTVMYNGKDLTKYTEREMQTIRGSEIAMVFQDPMTGTAATMSIEENMAIAARRGERRGLGWGITKKERERYKEALKELDLGLEDRLSSKVGLLSGGQRQAITLLMASLKKPKLLLLDEHTAALDPGTAEKVLNLTRRIVEEHQLTCLMITHNMQSAIDLGNRILMMDSGNIVLDIGEEEKKNMTVDALLEKFKTGAGKALDNDRILLSE